MGEAKAVGCVSSRVRTGQVRPRWGIRFALICLMAGLTLAGPARAAEKNRIEVNDYRIDATINPAKHHLWARAQLRFTALDDISTAIFELHNDLRPSRVTDAAGHAMQVERVSQDSTVRVSLPDGLPERAVEHAELRVRRRPDFSRGQSGGGIEARLYRRPFELPALCRTLVPGGGIWHRPLYGHPSRNRARGLYGGGQRTESACGRRSGGNGSKRGRRSRQASASRAHRQRRTYPQTSTRDGGRESGGKIERAANHVQLHVGYARLSGNPGHRQV